MVAVIEALFFLGLSLALSPFVAHGTQASCHLNIRPSTVSNSWQSSSFLAKDGLICFRNSTGDRAVGSYQFFQTAVANPYHGNNGFHWFVVKLERLTLLTSVTIRSRATEMLSRWEHRNTDPDSHKDVRSRSSNIEVWTSPSDILEFGSDHCSSRGAIGSQFQVGNSASWKSCGKSWMSDSVTESQNLNVVCPEVHLTRFLLLRKFVMNEPRMDRQCMSFIDLRISYVVVMPETNKVESPGTQNLTVRCSISCPTSGAKPVNVSLCHPEGWCFNSSETRIQRVQESDSGNFTCQVDGHVVGSRMLQFQYHPSKLEISLPGPGICSDESPANVTFKFASSVAEPTPKHRCETKSSEGESHLMELLKHENVSRGDVISYWLCANCSRSGLNITVSCTAEQSGFHNESTLLHWTCEQTKHLGPDATNVHVTWMLLLVSVVFVAFAVTGATIAVRRIRSLAVRTRRAATNEAPMPAPERSEGDGVECLRLQAIDPRTRRAATNEAPMPAPEGSEGDGVECLRLQATDTTAPEATDSQDDRCSYTSVRLNSAAATCSAGSTETVYLEIIRDETNSECQVSHE